VKRILNSISIKNFKSLRNTKFELRPITLLVGANNSGKTSFISLLLTLKQTLASRSLESPFVLEGPYVQLGSFTDVVYKHDLSKKIRVSMEFTSAKSNMMLKATKNLTRRSRHRFENYSISFQVQFDKESETILLTDLEIMIKGSKRPVIRVRNGRIVGLFGKRRSIPLEIKLKDRKRRRGTYPLIAKRHFTLNVYLPRSYRKDTKDDSSSSFLEYNLRRISTVIEQFFDEFIHYIGPLREYPKRYYISTGEKPSDVGPRGEKTIDLLYLNRAKITKELGYWLKKFKMAKKINLKKVASGIWKLELLNLKTGLHDNLKDVGFGVSQILPILTEGLMAECGSTLIVEQPEIHLHPRAQAQLADLFISLAKDGKSSIIETHSEHMILRLARRIAQGQLNKNDIILYEFSLLKGGSNVKKVEFDDFGNLKEWPAEFFETELEETMKYVKAQGIRRKNKGKGVVVIDNASD